MTYETCVIDATNNIDTTANEMRMRDLMQTNNFLNAGVSYFMALRIINTLRNDKCFSSDETVQDFLRRVTPADILRTPGFGHTCPRNLNTTLSHFGFQEI